MAKPLIGGLPYDLDLDAGWIIRVAALDPTTGAAVNGVTVTNFAILVRNLTGGDAGDLAFGPFLLVPGPESG
jgi:hypothetical protein